MLEQSPQQPSSRERIKEAKKNLRDASLPKNEIERCREILTAEYRDLLGLERDPDVIVVIPAGFSGRKIGDNSYKWTPNSWDDESVNFPPDTDTSGAYGSKYKPGYNARLKDDKKDNKDVVVYSGGGKARAIAGAELFSVFHKPIITLSQYAFGSKEEDREFGTEIPKDMWRLYRHYLESIKKVPEDFLFSEKMSTDTFQGLIETVKASREYGWKQPAIITNEYHIPRIKKMWEYLMDSQSATSKMKFVLARMPKYFQEIIGFHVDGPDEAPTIVIDSTDFFDYVARVKPAFIAAEDILALRDPRFATLFDEVKKTDWYQRRVNSEEWGLGRLEKDIYK